MAVSAFRSTTKRSCQIRPSESSRPSSPVSREETPSHKGSHRRSRSVADLAQKYFSDSSSTSEYRNYNVQSARRGGRSSSRLMSSDSESDMDGTHIHRRYRQKSIDLSDISKYASSVGAIDAYHQRRSLRRTSSHQDLSQYEPERFARQVEPVSQDGLRGDHPEDNTEEKTIRAVFAQMKSLRTDPPIGDFDTSSLYDAMRAEVRRAVAEIRTELEQSMQKNRSVVDPSGGEDSLDLTGTDVIQAVTNIRKEYTAKLEQSEKRVRELWSQLAVEEQRCLELAKIVKELLPAPKSSSNGKRSHKRRGSAERQLVSRSLDEEAEKFFEECVSISSLDCPGDLDDVSQDNDQLFKPSNDGSSMQHSEGVKKATEKAMIQGSGQERNAQSEVGSSSKGGLVENDGVVLPWLQWEADFGINEKNLKKEGKKQPGPRSSNSRNFTCVSSSNDRNISKNFDRNHGSIGSLNTLENVSNSGKNSSLNGSNTGGLSSVKKVASRTESSTKSSPVSFTGPSTKGITGGGQKYVNKQTEISCKLAMQGSSAASGAEVKTVENLFFPDLDDLMLERLRFKRRIERGEIILCQGLIF